MRISDWSSDVCSSDLVVKIETYGTYSCRNIYGGRSGRLSQHAYSNAIDVSGFVLADGRRIMLDGGWDGDKPSQDFLRALHKSGCRRFGTVLGPDYNAAHYNHFHLDRKSTRLNPVTNEQLV